MSRPAKKPAPPPRPPIEQPTHWEDGTRRSTGNGFVLGVGSTPHGYAPELPAAPAAIPRKYGSGDSVQFGQIGGTMKGLGKS